MKLGTPLSASAVRVMLLGSGELGKEVIIALQRLGTEVIAVDRYPHAPGHQLAHRWHAIDMTDPQALRALVEQERPHFIVPDFIWLPFSVAHFFFARILNRMTYVYITVADEAKYGAEKENTCNDLCLRAKDRSAGVRRWSAHV